MRGCRAYRSWFRSFPNWLRGEIQADLSGIVCVKTLKRKHADGLDGLNARENLKAGEYSALIVRVLNDRLKSGPWLYTGFRGLAQSGLWR